MNYYKEDNSYYIYLLVLINSFSRTFCADTSTNDTHHIADSEVLLSTTVRVGYGNTTVTINQLAYLRKSAAQYN